VVYCTGSTAWRNHQPASNDTVLLLTGTSSDSQFESTTGCIPALLKCGLVVEDSESSIPGLLPLVQTIQTGFIHQTTSMVIVEERDQSLMYCMMEVTVGSLISASEAQISSLSARSKVLYTTFCSCCCLIACGGI
jgi:hypothetical protein